MEPGEGLSSAHFMKKTSVDLKGVLAAGGAGALQPAGPVLTLNVSVHSHKMSVSARSPHRSTGGRSRDNLRTSWESKPRMS